MKNLLVSAAIALFILIPTYSNASLITFDLTGNNEGVENTFIFSENSLSLTISAWTTSYDSDNVEQESWQQVLGDYGVYKDSTGLGVVSNGEDGEDLDGGRSGSYETDPDEGLLLEFSQAVYLHDLMVSDLGSNDDINLAIVDFISPTEITLEHIFWDRGRSGSSRDYTYDNLGNISGKAFMVWVDGRSDDVRFDGVSVTAVNEPHALLLLGLGLIGLARRRK